MNLSGSTVSWQNKDQYVKDGKATEEDIREHHS